MPAFVRIETWTALRCQSGTRLGVLYPQDLTNARDVLAIDDTESLSFSFSRVNRQGGTRSLVSSLVGRTIASVVWDDGSFDERRISLVEDGRGIGGLINVAANPLILDLAEGADSSAGKGFVSSTSNCLRVFDFTVANLTATEIFDTYIIPNCPSWVSRGTIDPTVIIPQLSWSRLTPHALALLVRDTLRKMNVTCELRLRRNGTTDYKLDLVTQVGSSATVPVFHPRTSLRSLKRRFDTTQQATRVFVTGETDPSELPGIPGRARWKVTAVDAGNKKLTLADPNGGNGPIGMTNQWQNAYLVRVLTGRSFQIQASDASAQTVTLLALSTIAADEYVEMRLTEPGNNTRTIATPSPRFAVTGVGALGEYVQCASNPVTVDGQHLDWYARVWTASVGGSVRLDIRITGSTAATDRLACDNGVASAVQLTDYVEIVQLDGAGEIPSYLDHATYIPALTTGYGMKAADLAVTTVMGVTNLVANSWMRDWSNGANPPDGWSVVTGGGGGALARNTNASFIRYGPYSYSIDFYANLIQTKRLDVVLAEGNRRISARAYVLFTTFSGGATFTFGVYARNADGTLGTLLGSDSFTTAALNAWITMEIAGIDIGMHQAPYGVVATLQSGALATSLHVGYLDTIEVYGFVSNPETVYEHGDATALHQSGNRKLVADGSPPVAYELTIADVERADPTGDASKLLTIGGSVRAVDSDFGIDTTVRLLRLERDLLRPKQSTVGLATLPTLLTQLAQTH